MQSAPYLRDIAITSSLKQLQRDHARMLFQLVPSGVWVLQVKGPDGPRKLICRPITSLVLLASGKPKRAQWRYLSP